MEKITKLQANGKQYELGAGGGSTSKLVKHTSADTDVAIAPNEMHVWDEMASLKIQLAAPTDDTIVNEYMFQFTSPAAAPTTLTLPATIKWYNDFTVPVLKNKIYQASIINNIIVMGSVSR